MGLDNGIVIKKSSISFKMVSSSLIRWLERNGKDFDEEYQVCYWRKCWGFRNKVLPIIDGGDDGETSLTVDNLIQIRQILKSYTKENWDDDNYWDWVLIRGNIKRQIKILSKLIRLKKKYEELEIVFYDSY